MTRATVRHGIQAYLSGQIPGVGTVFASPPKVSRTSDALVGAAAGTASASVLYVEVPQGSEVRAAFGGPQAGKKMITYDVQLYLYFHSVQRRAEDAMDDHDAQVEAILERLRADRTLGTSTSANPLLQAGEEDTGITHQTSLPKDAGGGSVDIWTAIMFKAEEFITL